MGPEPAMVEPAGDGDAAPDVTNEANGPVAATDNGRRTADDGERMTDHGPGDATNEASGPSEFADRPAPAVPVTAVALLVLLLTAGLTAVFATSVKVSDPGYSSREKGDDKESQYTKGIESIVRACPEADNVSWPPRFSVLPDLRTARAEDRVCRMITSNNSARSHIRFSSNFIPVGDPD